uniref:RHS repeat-associated core domain-containing protein n=1 Tax=Oscillatoria salina TaxID=331517 RepID=UPI001CD03D34
TYGYDLISQVQDGEGSFYHVDGLGSTRLLTDAVGAVTDTYTYDAYGNLVASSGSSKSDYLFAGEQRDGETGLDYLRARYYDPTLGRFISADAYDGSLNDPMSLHNYQYAHANPIVNTDPSGYVTIQQVLTAIGVHSILASMSFTTGYALGTVLATGNPTDAAEIYDRYFAGFADAFTFGTTTMMRRQIYGETATKNHQGGFFNLGRLGGSIASMIVGAQAPGLQELGQASLSAKVASVYDLWGFGLGVFESGKNIMEGRATLWDILPFLPILGWFNVNYKLTSRGLGSNGGNVIITPRNPHPPISIYRGTDFTDEINIFKETGYIMSDAARDGYNHARYVENRSIKHSIEYARKASRKAHQTQLEFWGSLDDYVQAHSGRPQEVRDAGFRSMISFTTDSDEVYRFMSPNRGIIVTREIQHPYDLIIPQTLPGAGESEQLVLHMIKNVRIIN